MVMADELSETTQEPIDHGFWESLDNPDVHKLYANSFTSGFSDVDCVIIFGQHNKPHVAVSLSYSVAKSVAQNILRNVKTWEEKFGQEIPTRTPDNE